MFENGADYLRRQAINLSATNGRQSLRIEQWQQTAPGVERDQVIAATDVGLANKNLRHRAPTGDRHHFRRAAPDRCQCEFLQTARRLWL